jgi:hypothetical protein
MSNKLLGKIIAAGELSTKIAILPSKRQAAVVSGRTVYLNFGNGLSHFQNLNTPNDLILQQPVF